MIRSLFPALLLPGLLLVSPARAADFTDDEKISGFAIGCQCWSFNKFSVFEAIEKTAQAGGKVIEFFPGQKLSPDEPNVKFDHNSPPEVVEKVKAKCAAAHLTPVAYGVVGIPRDEAGARKVFEFAKALGLRVINTESVDAIDTFEKLVKEYDIKVGFHDHPRRPDDPNYKMWDPTYILSLVKNRDPQIGSCVRSGLNPIYCLETLKGRIMSSHLKDLNKPLPSAHDVPYGTGVSDIKAVLDEFKAQGFDGPISIEYEYKMDDNLAEVTKCIDFVRAYGEKK
jgi:sugar phosphate isomerase/epimerase